MKGRRQFLSVLGGIALGSGVVQGQSIEDPDPATDPETRGVRNSYNVRVRRDITFRETPEVDLKLNIYEPVAHAWSPAFIWVHGGAWRGGRDLEGGNPLLTRLAQHGYTGLDITYRLSNEAPYPAGVIDVKAAVKWLRKNYKEYNIEKDKIGIGGGSAGGHLAALVATTPHMEKFEPEEFDADISSAVQACIPFYGAFDFSTYQYPPATTQWFGGTYGEEPELHDEASPINHVTEDTPPHFLIHGTNDHAVPVSQSYEYEEVLRDHGVHVETWYPPGAPHLFELEDEYITETLQRVEDFVCEHLPKEDLLSQGVEPGNRMDTTNVEEGEGAMFSPYEHLDDPETRCSCFEQVESD